MEKCIKSSSSGSMYISFGSAARVSQAFKEDFQNILFTAMASSNMNFIWK